VIAVKGPGQHLFQGLKTPIEITFQTI
jgi:hypothetical protein